MRRSRLWAIFAFAVLGLLAGAWARQALPAPVVAAARLAPGAERGGGPLGTTPTGTATPAPAGSATPTPGVTCVANFRDVPTEYWAYGYIEWIYCHSIVNGYDCGTGCMEFRPEANTTRAQI